LSIYNKTKKSSNLGDAINSFEKSLFGHFVHSKQHLNDVERIKKLHWCFHVENLHDAILREGICLGAIKKIVC